MNAERRKRIADIRVRLGALKDEIESLFSDESDAYDAIPDSMKDGERGEKAAAARDWLEQAGGNIDEADTMLEDAAA